MRRITLGRRSRRTLPSQRLGISAFTLVEIMVVVGIITVLVALLMPALSHVREAARRTKCTANLKDMGAAVQAFANSHGGRFPMCYRMRDTDSLGYPYYTPFVIAQSDGLSNDADVSLWTIFGTSWTAWQESGVTLGTLSCPSSMRVATMQDLTTTNPEWGAVVWSNYMYVGGLTTTIMATAPGSATKYLHYSVPNWGGTYAPAVTNADSNLSELILAADMVFYSGGSPGKPSGWDITGRWVINHVAADQTYDPTTNQFFPMPDFQNILYGDGHVASKQRADFPNTLNTVNAPKWQWNFSMIQTDPSQQTGGYMYWGQSIPIPPDPLPPGPPGNGLGPPLPKDAPPPPIAPPPFAPKPGSGPGSPVFIPGSGG